ncbi:HEAT repeat domain-containing protein [Streptomyces sp. SID12501]|uniref:HEAT repeat domain-containing protein n=1 Tax=Streptomyces sp. SID12501 TaxID=2706042 RepID=A0A6B3BSW1_9ACTN|nr:HEAT repeat domain-containing protein [Streptomyces sp. SID12501]NEC87441.1 HEAT repeat domain-containing protein [Streptomyces sp. SID12501]
MASRIAALVQQMDGAADESMDARTELIHIGHPAVPVIIDGLPFLGSFGQLTAIEVFEEVGDLRCGPALIELLASDNSTVREWAALALADLGIRDAVEPLWRAYRACMERAIPPDRSEPGGFRWALTELGARRAVTPPSTAALRTMRVGDVPAWPSIHYGDIVNDLADHEQVILCGQFWKNDGDSTCLVSGPELDRQLDWTAPWPELVESAREWALLEATEAPAGENIVVTIEWIDHTDLHP